MDRRWSARELGLLGRTPLFRDCPEETIQAAGRHPLCSLERFDRGTAIYTPCRFRRSLGVVLRGSAQVTKGRLVVSRLGPGELFGAAALFHRRERFESTITAQENCLAAFFPEELVLELVGSDPLIRRNYLSYLTGRIHFLSQRVEALSAPGAAQKLARYLWEEDRRQGVTCSATELARRLDVGRSSLYRAFETLEEAGAIRREGKRVTILDHKALADAAGS